MSHDWVAIAMSLAAVALSVASVVLSIASLSRARRQG